MPGGEASPLPAGGYSIRKRALDLLFTMCDRSNAGEIVGELLEYLTVADFNIREDLVPPPLTTPDNLVADEARQYHNS